MTKEQILKVLKENLKWQNYTDGNDSWDSELKEAVTESIELLEQQPSDDCIARKPLIKNWECCADMLMDEGDSEIVMSWIFDAPPVTPIHGTCKNCKLYRPDQYKNMRCQVLDFYPNPDFYCADFEKRGNENESIN